MATEKRLIDANAYVDELKWLQEQVSSASAIEIQEYIDRTNRQHTVDAVEVVHGRWKFLDIDGWWFDECSICGNTTPNRDGSPPDWNYCPNCGAKMDGDGNG